jgi:cytochrome b6-f complex iron-sulfur subunit
MQAWTLTGLVVAGAVVLAAALVIAINARRRASKRSGRLEVSEAQGGGEGIDRRQLLEQGIIGAFVAALAGVVAAAVAYVWPSATGETGEQYQLGPADDLRQRIARSRTPYYDAAGHFYVVTYPASALVAAAGAYRGEVLAGMREGFVALSPRCPHLGCRVPWCSSSQWFECPCHGSRFNAAGERRAGPTPRGLDHFAVTVVDGAVVVDTRARYLGAPPGTDSTHQPAAGRHCT